MNLASSYQDSLFVNTVTYSSNDAKKGINRLSYVITNIFNVFTYTVNTIREYNNMYFPTMVTQYMSLH